MSKELAAIIEKQGDVPISEAINEIESTIEVEIDRKKLPALYTQNPIAKTSRILKMAIEEDKTKIKVPVSFLTEFILENKEVTLSDTLNFKAVEGINEVAGKYSANYGNVAIIDCSGLDRFVIGYFQKLALRFQ